MPIKMPKPKKLAEETEAALKTPVELSVDSSSGSNGNGVVHTPYGKKERNSKKSRPTVSFTPQPPKAEGVIEDDNSSQAVEEASVQTVDEELEYTFDEKAYRRFVNDIAPAIGMNFIIADAGRDPFSPNLIWKDDGGNEIPAYLITLSEPIMEGDNPQYSFAVPYAFLEANNSDGADFLVFVYIRFAKKSDQVALLTGVWAAHIQDMFELLDSFGKRVGDNVVFDVRLFDCYSINTMGNPVRMVID